MKTKIKSNTAFMRLQTHSFDFYKDDTGWYIDFPEFIEKGLGTKDDLAMVLGADQMLDYLGGGTDRVALTFSNREMSGVRGNPAFDRHLKPSPNHPSCRALVR